MAEYSLDKPLLDKPVSPHVSFISKSSLFVSSVKRAVKLLIWVVFLAWSAVIFLYPADFMSNFFRNWNQQIRRNAFGITGSMFMAFSAPVLVIALLSTVYIIFSDDEEIYQKKEKHPRIRLWTFPVVVKGPFQVVSAAEFIGLAVFFLYIVWALYAYTRQILGTVSPDLAFNLRRSLTLKFFGHRFGSTGMFYLIFLFLPVSRGSVLLRLVEIPFEHATRYHVWLGHLTMLLFTVHGLLYLVAWAIQGRLLDQILKWNDTGVATFPGLISLLAGLFMWVTSLPAVRRRNFELFFYTHQLYVIFFVFLALHVGDFIFGIVAAGIFLFMADRFLRFCQSRKRVDIISTRSFPCGTVELVLSKPPSVGYNALSFIFLQVRELSLLQWHPFSVSSSPLDGEHHLSVLVKDIGTWTANLTGKLENKSELESPTEMLFDPHSKITAFVEGPHGHHLPYPLRYENLVLVAGGIGISPFLAIVRDIRHRIREKKPCLPKNILIVWAVKKSIELSLLSALNVESISPSFPKEINIDIQIYVTRESRPPLEEGKVENNPEVRVYYTGSGSSMSGLVGTGDKLYWGLYFISSIVGFVLFTSLIDTIYVNPFNIQKRWFKGLLFVGCMAASVFLFGGSVVALWHFREKQMKFQTHKMAQQSGSVVQKDILGRFTAVKYGFRPDFKEILRTESEKSGRVDVGVIVCGPQTLQTSVAREIRSHNLRRRPAEPVYHFNLHSFSL